VTVAPGATAELRLRLRPADAGPEPATALGADFDRVVAQRQAEADEFYADLTPPDASADEAMVMRQAFGGLLWGKQFYYYDVSRWLDGDPAEPPPPPSRADGRNSRWRSFDAFDIMSMPDKWEYPWFAAWDLAFHCVALAHVDPAFAKYQLILLCREWFENPSGALPAYEWDFGDVNPPVQAWAALEVFAVDGARDIDFLSRVFDKLLVNFTWWVNREDALGNNLFEGGFLGLDNIGPLDRSHLPVSGTLEQSGATGWMGFYAMAMASIAVALDRAGQRPGTDLVLKFLEHFAGIRDAIDGQGLGEDLTIEYPTGAGRRLTFGEVASDLRDRLISLFVPGPDGRRPCFGGVTRLQDDPAWRDNLVFSEYFHGDNGAGLGASHQTGWTGLIADVIRRRHGALPSTGEVLVDMGTRTPLDGLPAGCVRPAGERHIR
jgi:hypothetical protein